MVRTVDGVPGERPLGACCALGVVLEPLSTLACFARGGVYWLPPSVTRCDGDRGLFSWLPPPLALGDGLAADDARLRAAPLGCGCVDGSAIGGPPAARLLCCGLCCDGATVVRIGWAAPPPACAAPCPAGSGLATPPTRGVPSKLFRFLWYVSISACRVLC